MRLDTSNIFAALLLVNHAEAGPIRAVRLRRQESTTPSATFDASADSGNFGDDLKECSGNAGSFGGGFLGGGGLGRIQDPQANPEDTPSPIICTIPTSASSGSEGATEVPSASEPEETAPATTEEPTEAPEGGAGETSPEQINSSPVIPTEEPSSEVGSETSAEERGTETPSSGAEEPTESGTGAEGTPAKETEPDATGPVASPSGTGSLQESGAGAIKTVTVTKTRGDEGRETEADPGATESATGPDGAAPTGIFGGGPGFTSNLSPPGGSADASTDASPSTSGIETNTDPSATPSATEGTDVSPAPTGVESGTDPNAVPSATGGTGVSSVVPSSAAASGTGPDPSATAIGPQPPPSGVPSDSSTENTITPTGSANPNIPTLDYTTLPVATTTLSPEEMDANIKKAKDLNQVYSTLTPLSACTAGQVVCIEGSLARCGDGAFSLEECDAGTSCLALPLSGFQDSVQIKCATEQEASILGPDGAPSQASSGGVGQAPSESPSPVPSESPSQAPCKSASQIPSQPADNPTTTVVQESTVTVTSVVTPTRSFTFSSIIGGLPIPPAGGKPGDTPAQSTELGAVIPTTLGASEPAETQAPSPTNQPTETLLVSDISGAGSTPRFGGGDAVIHISVPARFPISPPAPQAATTVLVTVTAEETVTETVTSGR